jgi:hypothetical protein
VVAIAGGDGRDEGVDELLSWFLDAPAALRMALAGKAAGKDVGMWFGPSAAAGAIRWVSLFAIFCISSLLYILPYFFLHTFWVAELFSGTSHTLHFRYPYTPHPRYPRRLSTIPIPLLSASSAAASHFPPSFLPSGFLSFPDLTFLLPDLSSSSHSDTR